MSVPSKGINNQFIGQVELTGKPVNQFFPVDFDLPASVVATLQAGGYSDFRAKIVINVPFNATGNYLLDNLHFLSGAVGFGRSRRDEHPAALDARQQRRPDEHHRCPC